MQPVHPCCPVPNLSAVYLTFELRCGSGRKDELVQAQSTGVGAIFWCPWDHGLDIFNVKGRNLGPKTFHTFERNLVLLIRTRKVEILIEIGIHTVSAVRQPCTSRRW